jgi:hypothetical protein
MSTWFTAPLMPTADAAPRGATASISLDPMEKGPDRRRIRSLRYGCAARSRGSERYQVMAQSTSRARPDRASRLSTGPRSTIFMLPSRKVRSSIARTSDSFRRNTGAPSEIFPALHICTAGSAFYKRVRLARGSFCQGLGNARGNPASRTARVALLASGRRYGGCCGKRR